MDTVDDGDEDGADKVIDDFSDQVVDAAVRNAAGESDEVAATGEAADGDSRDLDGDIEHEAEEEHEAPRALRDPGQPTQAEIDEHDLSHIPYRPWCKHCVYGKAKDKQSRRLCAGYSQCEHPRVRLDYTSLTDKASEASGAGAEEEAVEQDETRRQEDDEEPAGEEDSTQSVTMLVMQESEHKSVWAYQVEHKGASEAWVLDQIVEDLDTVGLRNEKIVMKSDQEPAAAEVSRAVARSRVTDFGTGIEHSSVGDSNSNATGKEPSRTWKARSGRFGRPWRPGQR